MQGCGSGGIASKGEACGRYVAEVTRKRGWLGQRSLERRRIESGDRGRLFECCEDSEGSSKHKATYQHMIARRVALYT